MLQRLGKPPSTLSDQTRALLLQYPWPGNVRELRNVVDQVVNLGEESLPELDSFSGTPPLRRREEQPGPELPFKEAKDRLIESRAPPGNTCFHW